MTFSTMFKLFCLFFIGTHIYVIIIILSRTNTIILADILYYNTGINFIEQI